MKKTTLALLIAASLTFVGCNGANDAKDDADPSKEQAESSTNTSNYNFASETEEESYALGARMGMFLKTQIKTQNELGLESDREALIAGFTEALKGEAKMTEEQVQQVVEAFSVKYTAAEQEKMDTLNNANLQAGKDFLAKNAEKEGVITTDSGLQYEVIQAGEGDSPSATDTVRVHYHGTLIDGTVFDSSVERGTPAEFPLNRVIKGWTEGVALMKKGAKYRFYIPAELAYGSRATGSIKPFSALIFDVELIDITTPSEQ